MQFEVSLFVAGLQFEQLVQSLGAEQFANKTDTGSTCVYSKL
jgi:hypothetical protein